MISKLLSNTSLFVLVLLVAVRPLINETYDSAASSIDRAVGAVGESTPLRTLLFDLVILLSALTALIVRWRDSWSLGRSRVIVLGFGLLVVAGAVSCFFAGNKRLAINATIDWLCFPILAATLVCLMRERWQRRLLLAAVMGSAAIQTLECVEQYYYGFDETIAHYEQNKEAFWRSQGIEPDAPRVDMFEGRMYAREVSGTMPHSSVAASYLLLAAFAGIGLCLGFVRSGHVRGRTGDSLALLACVVLTLLIAFMLGQTGSRGAILAGVGAMVLWIAAFAASKGAHVRRRVLFGAAWVGFALLVIATIGYGLYYDALPGVSLSFRWQYWTASAEMMADHPLTGVGRENFGRHYLQYKSIQSPEEVSNPHNLFVQAGSDWGVLGLLGLVLLLFGGSRMIVLGGRNRNRERDATDVSSVRAASGDPPSSVPTDVLLFPVLAIAVLGIRVPLLGTADVNYIYYETVTGLLAWLVGAGAVWFGLRGTERSDGAGVAEHAVATAVGFGLLAFLIHDLINFALFVPATATTFCALLATVISVRWKWAGGAFKRANSGKSPDDRVGADAGHPASWWITIGFLSVALGATVWLSVIPVARAGSQLALARVSTQDHWLKNDVNRHPARMAFEKAARRDGLDPTPLAEQGQWLAALAQAHPASRTVGLDMAVDSLNRAVPRDPFNAGIFRALRQVYLMRAEDTKRRSDFDLAIDAAQQALALYPQDPPSLVSLADTYAEAGRALKDDAFLPKASATYQAALDLDDQRIEWERLRRFRPSEREKIQRKIEALRVSVD